MNENQIIDLKETQIQKIMPIKQVVNAIFDWAHVSADQPTLEDDFYLDNKQIFQYTCNLKVKAKQEYNEQLNLNLGKTTKLNGEQVNNLKEKAKMIALSKNKNNSEQKEQQQKWNSSDDEHDQVQIQKGREESGDKKVFRLSENSIKKDENKLEQGFRYSIVEIQQKKVEIKQISFIETWDKLKRSQEIKDHMKFIEQKSSLVEKLIGCFNVNLKNNRLINEKIKVDILSKISFDDNNECHFRMLYTIYCQLMTTDFCLRYGSHWELIGFQGTDPATELGNGGILGLVQMLAFISDYKQYVKNALNILSQINIPLSITLMGISSLVLMSLKDNKLNYLINKEDSVISVINKLYFAGFNLVIKVLKKEQMPLNIIKTLLTNVRKQIHEHPQKLIKQFQQDIQMFYKINDK
ncbi:unnamed protein product [Paramecium sonneborni]|uniref:ELMO domain-containing protein n=1 Tax=Paramecium sonneborni TaxID=65129 RepID=A0A8S1P1T8_9CILI|nr:unnamed protein product [Paramecium sonneborni]